uniref:C1q domain-containing protein n=1 Tax=Neogobius melanostomus TaxID=47308 RepID=A0A8C6TSS0_9GOBI
MEIEQDKPESVDVLEQPQPSPSDLHAVVRDMSAKLAALQTEMKQMRTCNQAGQVAFSASLVTTGAVTMGSFNTHTPVIFRHVVTNIGNAYNPNTGFFIAPVRGAYRFEFYILGPMDGSHASWAFLVKNTSLLLMRVSIEGGAALPMESLWSWRREMLCLCDCGKTPKSMMTVITSAHSVVTYYFPCDIMISFCLFEYGVGFRALFCLFVFKRGAFSPKHVPGVTTT